MNLMRGRKGKAGFTLVQVVIGMGIMSITLLALSEVLQLSARAQMTNQRLQEISQFADLASQLVQDDTLCSKNFEGQALNLNFGIKTAYALDFKNIDSNGNLGTSFLQVGDEVGKGVILQDVKYEILASLGSQRYTGKMYYTLKSNVALLGGDTFVRSSPFHFKTDTGSTPLVVSCGRGVLSATASAGGNVTWMGYASAVTGKYAGPVSMQSRCEATFPGSRPAKSEELFQLGSAYPSTYDVWVRDVNYNAIFGVTLCTSNGPLNTALYSQQCNCQNWSVETGGFSAAVLRANKTLGMVSCDTSLRIPCVK